MGSIGVGGSLSAASDVSLNSPASGQSLKQSGGYWINENITKADVGLGSVDNTRDADKPVSTAQANAIAAVDGGGPTTIEDLPAGSTVRVMSPTSSRPTVRTDIAVIWVAHNAAPANAIPGDLWLEPAA